MKRVAIVSGAAKPDSIGFAVARGLIEEGCEVFVADLYTEGFSAFRGPLRQDRCRRAFLGYMTGVTVDINGASYLA